MNWSTFSQSASIKATATLQLMLSPFMDIPLWINLVPANNLQLPLLTLHVRELNASHIDLNEDKCLNPLLKVNRDVFAVDDQELGHTALVQHHNDTGNERPVRKPQCHVPPLVRKKLMPT